MFWTILIIIVVIILFSFFKDVNKDNADLQGQNLNEKFKIVVNSLNEFAYQGLGQVNVVDKREFTLYKQGENQIIHFFYGTGHLTITWRYKYFQKEVVHKKVFHDVRNLSIFEQDKLAQIMISEMQQVILNHQTDVLRG